MSKLESLRVYNSVKCGKNEFMYMTSDLFDMVLEGSFVEVTHKASGSEVTVPITNVPWFKRLKIKPEEKTASPVKGDKVETKQAKGSQSPKRGTKKTRKKA